MKIVQELSQKRYLTAIRGKNGGLLLGRQPETTSLGKLVRDTEHEMALVECFRDENNCVIMPSCRLRPILAEALAAFLSVLDQYTLADLLEDRTSQLSRLMRIPTLTIHH